MLAIVVIAPACSVGTPHTEMLSTGMMTSVATNETERIRN